MRTVPRRSAPITVSVLAAVFFGAAALGLALAAGLAPGSHVAAVVSFLLLPAVLVLGFHAWLGLAVLLMVSDLLVRVLRGGPARPRIGAGHTVVPPGAWAFLPIGSTLGLLGGLVAGALSPERTIWLVAGAYWVAGTAYGGGLWGLARHGYLPFPDSG